MGPSTAPERRELQALVDRIARRDEAALSALYDATSRFVFGLVARIVGDPASAEDVTLDVYLQVWRTAAHYDASRGTVTAWLAMAARSRAIDWLRCNHRRLELASESLQELADPLNPSPDPELLAMEGGRAKLVHQALASLPQDQRQLIELAYFSGLSQSEMAEHLAMPLGTVKSKVRIGLTRMREMLGPYAEGAL